MHAIRRTTTGKLKVLIVDDSATVRQVLKEILESDPQIEVMGVASDPYVAVDREEEVRRCFYQLPSHRILLNLLYFGRGPVNEQRSGLACTSIMAGWGLF